VGFGEQKSIPTAFLTALLTGIVFGLVLHYSRLSYLNEVVRIFIVMILAFLVSDMISPLIIRGGHGIVQTFGSTRTRPKAYAFLVLFISIPITGVVIDWLSRISLAFLIEGVPLIVSSQVSQVQVEMAGLIADLVVALVLAFLVYFDLQAKYYAR
jgi:hypothetical protein